MAQPLTGTTWIGAGFANLNPENFERGPNLRVFVRDSRGTATDISPHNADGSVRYSPFAQDGKLRGDLLARIKSNGYWVTNPEPNQGFLDVGQFKDGSGPKTKPSIKQSQYRVIQSNWSYHTAITEESEMFSFIPVDTGLAWNQHLRKNLRLSDANGNIIVPDQGQLNAGFSRLASGGNPGRQFLIARELLPPSGLPIWKFDGYALAYHYDIGDSSKDKEEGEGAELTYDPVLDGVMMAMAYNNQGVLEYQPVLMHTWYGGPGWTAQGGVPELSATPPVATATDDNTATLAFAEPTGAGDPWNYEDAPAGVQQSTDAGVTWGSLISPDSVAVSSGTVTLTVSGLDAGASLLRATVMGTNGAVATTPNSNSVTITGS